MSDINWGLGLAPNIGMNAFNAFQQGQQAKQQDMARSALTSYALDPNENNLNALAPHMPEYVIGQRQQMKKQQDAEVERKLVGDALSHPDPATRARARQQLAYTNSDLYMKLDEGSKKKVDATMHAIGQQAFHIMQLPKEQQEPALQQALQGLQAQGIDTSSFHLTGNPDVDLRTALAVSGQLDDFEKFAEPKYVAKTEFGMAGFQYGRPIMEGGQPKDFAPPASANIPQGAVDYLKANPSLKAEFDAKYGTGAADRVLGGVSGNAGGNFRPVGNGVSVIKQLFPKATVTSGYRPGGRKESWHTQSHGAVDIAPIPGMTFDQYVNRVRGAGYNIIEARDEVINPSQWSTGPHWHIVIGER